MNNTAQGMITDLLSFNGRIGRGKYWLYILLLAAIMILPAFTIYEDPYAPEARAYVDIAALILLWPVIAVQAKRWHDRNKSGLWVLIQLVPFIGIIWAIVENGFLPGSVGENQYGMPSL